MPRLCASTTDVQLASTAPTNEFWERLKSPVMARRKTALQRLSSLGSLSNISLPSRENYPSGRRHHHDRRGSVEPLVTIKCQRMNSDKRREEVMFKNQSKPRLITQDSPKVDIAVPLAVYRNLDTGLQAGNNSGQSRPRTSWQHLRRLVRV